MLIHVRDSGESKGWDIGSNFPFRSWIETNSSLYPCSAPMALPMGLIVVLCLR